MAGVLLGVCGAVLSLRSLLLLVGRGRPQRGPRPAFVIAGPYVRMRNPLFAGLVLLLAGVAVALASTALLIVAILAAASAHWWVVRFEEPHLRRRFGDAYARYLVSVPRWLPRRAR